MLLRKMGLHIGHAYADANSKQLDLILSEEEENKPHDSAAKKKKEKKNKQKVDNRYSWRNSHLLNSEKEEAKSGGAARS